MVFYILDLGQMLQENANVIETKAKEEEDLEMKAIDLFEKKSLSWGSKIPVRDRYQKKWDGYFVVFLKVKEDVQEDDDECGYELRVEGKRGKILAGGAHTKIQVHEVKDGKKENRSATPNLLFFSSLGVKLNNEKGAKYSTTDHIDGNHKNNDFTNIQLLSRGKNSSKGGQTRRCHGKAHSKAVIAMDKMNGDQVHVFESVRQAARELKLHQGDISAAALGKVKSAGGYLWRFVIDPAHEGLEWLEPNDELKKFAPDVQVSKCGKFIKTKYGKITKGNARGDGMPYRLYAGRPAYVYSYIGRYNKPPPRQEDKKCIRHGENDPYEWDPHYKKWLHTNQHLEIGTIAENNKDRHDDNPIMFILLDKNGQKKEGFRTIEAVTLRYSTIDAKTLEDCIKQKKPTSCGKMFILSSNVIEKVYKVDAEGNTLAVYNSCADAARNNNNITRQSVWRSVNENRAINGMRFVKEVVCPFKNHENRKRKRADDE